MNALYRTSKDIQKFTIALSILLAFNTLPTDTLRAQCDPSSIDPCDLRKNSIIQASYHAQIVKTSKGYSITGQELAPNGDNYQVVLTNIPSSSYPMPSEAFPVWGAIGGRTQAVFLGSDSRIYTVGQQGLLISNTHTSGSGWRVSSLALPEGITVCDVIKWEGSSGSGSETGNATGDQDGFLAFSTASGEIYITGNAASKIQAQASSTEWTKIEIPIGIKAVDFGAGYRTLLIQGDDGNLYASGPNTYLGNGSSANLNSITKLLVQPVISVSGISQIEAGFHSFLVLDGDGTIHVLGENSEGNLGVGNNLDVIQWSKVGQSCSNGILSNVAFISTLSSHDYRSASSAILVDESIRSWGMNDNQSITSGSDRLITCPITPQGNNSSAIAIANGGHITPYVNTDIQICNIGHNRQGAFGDGNDEEEDYGEYTCFFIPGLPEICGTNKADLELLKMSSDSTSEIGNEIVFTITVSNSGPDASSGSTVRDQLNSGYEYQSDDSNGAYNSLTGLWNVGPLDVGGSTSLEIVVRVLSSGDYSNYAQVFSDSEIDPDSSPGDNSDDQDDDDTVVVAVDPCPFKAKCHTLPSVNIGKCHTMIPSQYDAGNTKARAADIFTDVISCGIIDISHVDNIKMVNTCSSLTRTYSLLDDGFEILKCDRVFTFDQDIEGPNISCPSDVTLNCRDGVPPEEMLLNGTDNCSPETNFDIIEVSDNRASDFCLQTNEVVRRIYTAIDDCDNSTSCTQTLTFENDFIYAPNIFSPNNAINDVWTIFFSPNVQITRIRIFDRWGNLVFTTRDLLEWDGMSNGHPSAQGIYIYVIDYKDSVGDTQMKSGDITLLR